MKPKIPLAHWADRFAASRKARDLRAEAWADYARLHARAARAARSGALEVFEHDTVQTRRDKTRLGLVHRNVEQTLALLDVPEVAISATAVEFQREMDSVDDHAESVVSAAVTQSLRDSGLLAGPEIA